MKEQKLPWHYLFLLILAGEAVFILPFVLPRVFRPTVAAWRYFILYKKEKK